MALKGEAQDNHTITSTTFYPPKQIGKGNVGG